MKMCSLVLLRFPIFMIHFQFTEEFSYGPFFITIWEHFYVTDLGLPGTLASEVTFKHKKFHGFWRIFTMLVEWVLIFLMLQQYTFVFITFSQIAFIYAFLFVLTDMFSYTSVIRFIIEASALHRVLIYIFYDRWFVAIFLWLSCL